MFCNNTKLLQDKVVFSGSTESCLVIKNKDMFEEVNDLIAWMS